MSWRNGSDSRLESALPHSGPSRYRGLGAATTVAWLLATILSGCGLLPDWLGDQEAPPLPGQRISVLSLQETLEPDPAIADLQVRLPPPRVNPDWPQAGGRSSHAMHHLAVGDTLAVVWRSSIGTGSSALRRLLAAPVVAAGRVFALDARTHAVAIDAATGKRLWRASLKPADEESGGYGGGLAFADGVLYAATGYGEVFALDPGNGEVVWRNRMGVPIRAAPTVSSGRVFVISYDNRLHVLAADDGRELWSHEGLPEVSGLLGAASPAVDGGLVVAPYSSGELVALRVENGRVSWSDSLARAGRLAELARISDIDGAPVVDNGQVFAIGHGGRMVAVDLRSGAPIWDQLIAGTELPWLAGDFIYLVTLEAEIVCLWRRDGRVRWVTQLPRYKNEKNNTDPITWSGPVLASDRLVVVSSKGDALSVSPYTGKILGQMRLRDAAMISPVVAGGTIYILTDDADLIALR